MWWASHLTQFSHCCWQWSYTNVSKHIHQLPDWQDAVYEADQGSVWIGDVQYSSCAVSMFTMCTSDIHPQNTLNILQWLDVLLMSRSRGFCSLQNVNKTRAIVTDFRGERKATRPTSSERILMRSRKKGPDRALELTSTGWRYNRLKWKTDRGRGLG